MARAQTIVNGMRPNPSSPHPAPIPPPLTCIVTEDSLRANAPHIETLHEHGLHYLLGGRRSINDNLFTQVQAAEHAGRVTYYERHDRAAGALGGRFFIHLDFSRGSDG